MRNKRFFFSNYFFYFSGELYDAENSLLKPLMHTWSLSIEEQFYLLFPLGLVFFNSQKKIPQLETIISYYKTIPVLHRSLILIGWLSFFNF